MYIYIKYICMCIDRKRYRSRRGHVVYSLPSFPPFWICSKKMARPIQVSFVTCEIIRSGGYGISNLIFQSGYVWCVYLCHMNLGGLPTKTWESLYVWSRQRSQVWVFLNAFPPPRNHTHSRFRFGNSCLYSKFKFIPAHVYSYI